MTKLSYAQADKIHLKSHTDFNEKWIQEIIAEEPGLLGFGDLTLIAKEKIQEKAGRLDLLFADADDNTRYEVELMLGRTDESHIIRCIEYWDIERRRYPGYDHVAVLVAEDITSRFLNVLGLFSGTIPLIAIQLNALQVGDKIVLDFVRVLDQTLLRVDDATVDTSPQVDREFWETKRSTPKMVKYADRFLEVLNSKAQKNFDLNYVKAYIGLREGNITRGFVLIQPRKKNLRLSVQIAEKTSWLSRLDDLGVNYSHNRRHVRIMMQPDELEEHHALIEELIEQGVREFEG